MYFYCNINDKVPYDQRNHVIYKIKCPGCNGCYIGKTECLITRNNEHGTKETEPMFKQLRECESFIKIVVGCIPFRHHSMKMKMTISL